MTYAEENPSVDKAVEERFRRLLRAYPAWYRKQRGEEMLTTLMDASDGRDRPTAGQRADVVFGGLRKHLSAGSIPAAVVGVFVAVFVATLGAIGGSIAAWNTAVDLPDGAAADQLARQAVPEMGTDVYDYRHRDLFGWINMEGEPIDSLFAIADGDGYHAGRLAYEVEHKKDGYARLDEARDRLPGAGWDVGAVKSSDMEKSFSATRDGLVMEVRTAEFPDYPWYTEVDISRATPNLVPVLTVVGLIVGAVAGWMLTSWLARRVRPWSINRRAAMTGPLAFGGFILSFPTAICLYLVYTSLANPDDRVPVWSGFIWGPMAVVTMGGLGFVILGFLLGLAPKAKRRRVAQVAG
ncbi:hypothetical protein [Stackebrandtia nassauensis]|uniref:Uncharacterized protein n=1 Tax=Stackebrandtia nassauensis (strain DSM 44728 / CIP 108903 / NRRL B-16338 / NBRC 102104 / LLR-40K-21) TaxID=446470 RepID=D3PXE2_STANL|nr:hypothetical protein [Stackebrandtia nassauensis]ADD41405.1 hypothetical protein Snas_1706 [Stackebrandtia nassauensis DSM 44728]